MNVPEVAKALNCSADYVCGLTDELQPRAVETPAPTRGPATDPMTAEKVTTSQHWWRSCLNDPPKGWMLAVKFYPWNTDSHDFDLELVQFHDGKWWGVYENSDDELEITMYDLWMPAAAIPAEAWE